MKRLFILSLGLLTACGTPQEQCIAAGTRDLRVVDQLIAEAEGNLKRGYALEEKVIRFATFTRCRMPPPQPGVPPPPVRMCPDTCEQIVTRPKAIDLAEEARKLSQLQAKRADLARRAQTVSAQCRAEFPE
ncbi:MAG: hypothetical protein WAT09_17510 [Paracoccaceae bacterium]